jgi:general secretion pathway protein G
MPPVLSRVGRRGQRKQYRSVLLQSRYDAFIRYAPQGSNVARLACRLFCHNVLLIGFARQIFWHPSRAAMPTVRRSHRRTGPGRSAFTLIEMLMVIVALAIMAGVVIPQVSGAVDDAKQGTMLANLHELTNAIERYRMDHTGLPPDQVVGRRLTQLLNKTNVDGVIGTGPGFIYGPYLAQMPQNPLSDTANVYTVTTVPPSNLDKRIGWVYHVETGQIWAGLHPGLSGAEEP